jgi:hypothetical protein
MRAAVSLPPVRFKITRHSGYRPPDEALDLLLTQLGSQREGVTFAKVGAEIWATFEADAPVSMTRDERADSGRRAVLSVVRAACDGAPGLNSDWFAVSSGS